MTTTVGYGHQNWEKMRLFSAAFLVLARKAYNLKQNFCSLGVVPVFASFFLPLIVNTNKKINKYYRLVYFFFNDQYFQTTMNYGLPEARSLF